MSAGQSLVALENLVWAARQPQPPYWSRVDNSAQQNDRLAWQAARRVGNGLLAMLLERLAESDVGGIVTRFSVVFTLAPTHWLVLHYGRGVPLALLVSYVTEFLQNAYRGRVRVESWHAAHEPAVDPRIHVRTHVDPRDWTQPLRPSDPGDAVCPVPDFVQPAALAPPRYRPSSSAPVAADDAPPPPITLYLFD